MKKTLALFMIVALIVINSLMMVGFAATGNSESLDDIINDKTAATGTDLQTPQNNNSTSNTVTVTPSVNSSTSTDANTTYNANSNTGSSTSSTDSTGSTSSSTNSSVGSSNNTVSSNSFVNGLAKSSNLMGQAAGVDKATAGAKKVVSFAVQVLSYLIVILMTLRVVIDLLYIAIPFSRSILSNGFEGNPQAGAGGSNTQGGMGGGFGGGGFGGGFGGYNRFGGGYGMGGGMGGMNSLGMQSTRADQHQSAIGRIQWVSNAALNAVAGESTLGPDGKPVSAYRSYAKDMVIVLVITPILLVLALTGTLTNLGFMLGNLAVNAIQSIKGMV